MGSTLRGFSGVYRDWIGILRERLFCILRKHSDQNIVDYFEFGAVGSSDVNENVSCICTDLRMVGINYGRHRADCSISIQYNWIHWRVFYNVQIPAEMLIVLAFPLD